MENKKISFIIPTLNEEKIITKTLQNISSYSGQKEIIITDGHSTDKTIELAKRCATVVEHDGSYRQTIAAGRNAGAKIASGEYLVFLDADMYIFNPNEFFAKALEVFEKDPSLVAITVNLKVFKEMETILDKIIFDMVNFLHKIQNNILHRGAAAGEFQMIRTEIFKKIGGFNEALTVAEDQDMFGRLSKIGNTRFISSLTAYHTGRRAHAIGWPKLLYLWITNILSLKLLKKSSSKEWKVIR